MGMGRKNGGILSVSVKSYMYRQQLTTDTKRHIFAVEQPDLNWENPKVRAAVHDIIRFWLKRGTKGFRMDVINMISKDQRFPDAPIKDSEQEYQPGDLYYKCGPRLHEVGHITSPTVVTAEIYPVSP